MKKYSKIRKIIQVFHLYGISLYGERKFDNLYQDLKIERIFVMGLIFELELVSNVYLRDEDINSLQEPVQIIYRLL